MWLTSRCASSFCTAVGAEGDLHHGESSGCVVRHGSNQYLGLQVGRGEDRACLSSTYSLSQSSTGCSELRSGLTYDAVPGWVGERGRGQGGAEGGAGGGLSSAVEASGGGKLLVGKRGELELMAGFG